MQVAKLFISMLLSVMSLQANAGRIVSNGSGSFTSSSIWQGGVVPAPSDTAVIRNSDSVTLSGQIASVMALVIEPQGKLAMWTGTLLVSDSLLNLGFLGAYSASSVTILGSPDKGVVNRGILRIGFGTTWVLGEVNFCNRLFLSTGQVVINPNSVTRIYGRTRIEAGLLTQDGGQVFFYGNSGIAATSVAANNHIVFMDATGFTCTAGSMTVADAHHENFFPMLNTVEITGNNPQAFSGSHTWYMGDAISSKSAHLNRGITLGNGQKNGMKAPLNHLWVQTKFIGQRFFYTSITPNGGTYINGDFKVVFQSEARHVWSSGVEMAIGGDLEVDDGSIFTNSQPVILGAGSGYSVTKKQVVYSSGTIREDNVNPSFHFGALVFNNSLTGDTAVRFTAVGTIRVRDSIVFLAGAAAMHSLQLGNSNNVAQCRVVNGGIFSSIPHSPISITRYYKNNMGASVVFGSGYDSYPFASATDFAKRTLQVQVQQVGSGGNMQAIFYDGIGAVPATPSIHGIDNGIFCNTLSRQYWYLQAENGLAGTGVQIRCTGGNMLLAGSAANIRLHKSDGAIAGTSTGGGTTEQPIATKTNLPDLMAAGGTYYFAGNNSLLVTKIPSVSSGAFGQTTTWKFNYIPDENYGAIIKQGHHLQDATPGIRQLLSLEVENTGKLILAKPGGIFAVNNKTLLNGTIDITGNTRVGLSKWANNDTSLLIGQTGQLLVNHPQARVDLTHQFSADNKLAALVNYGNLFINEGSIYCLGYLHLLGSGNFRLGNEATLYFLPNGTQ
ncbi:MAG: hypothetical protein MUF24_02355, partial [Chitinophagaceae bacterium]|nr:hypothetical protein [Chitinophagaceae bacterium]